MMRKLLLGTTALVGLGALVAATPASAKMEVSVGGYARFGVLFGDNDITAGANARSLYFRDEFEVHVNGKAKDDATGTEYGVHVEFEMDNAALNVDADEAWIWMKGNWGELRLGNEDGAADLLKIHAGAVAAGTGGVDGWVGNIAPVGLHLMNSSDATKIVYFTPNIGGFKAGISYTPDSDHQGGAVARDDGSDGGSNYEHWIEAGAAYTADMGGAKFRISAQFSHANGEINTVPDFAGYSVGAQVEVSGFKIAGSWARNSFDGAANDNTRWTLGVGAGLGPANVSLTFAKQNSDQGADPRNIAVSGDVTLLPGVALQGDLAFFDLDTGGNDSGVTGLVRVHVGM